MSSISGNDRRVRRILLIKPSSLGDIVHALPVLAGLRRADPRAHIAWLIGTPFRSLLENHPLLDELIPFDRTRYGTALRSPAAARDFLRFIRQLRRRRFDLVLDLQGLVRSGFFAWASGAATRIGPADAREFAGLFYTRRLRCPPRVRHAVDKNLHFARQLGLAVDPPAFPLALQPHERRAAAGKLARAAGTPDAGFTAILPGARWETKVWPPARWAELIDRLHADGHPRCVLLGGPGDRDLADRIIAHCRTAPLDLIAQTTLRELAALLDQAAQVICADSGPMHIAAALGKPLVAVFGPTNPDRTGPYHPAARIARRPLDCSPCYRRSCPLGHHNCLRELDVATVLAEVRKPGVRPRATLAVPVRTPS